MPEKLLTIKEVADYLKISEEEVKRLVDVGEIPAYRIGDTFLRFRKEQIDAIRTEVYDFEKTEKPQNDESVPREKKQDLHVYTNLEREIKKNEPAVKRYDYSFAEKIKDFIYFNDFYIISLAVIALLLYLIFK